jgi:hypothetical protein
MTAAAHPSDTINWRVLEFEAPYLEDKFVATQLVETREQAAALFLELKKYLLLADAHRQPMPMMSALVDAAWHQFILYSAEYEQFCNSMFGRAQHHEPRSPGNRSAPASAEQPQLSTFVDAYREHFGPLPDLWHNERCLRPDTRLVHADASRLTVDVAGRESLLWREREPRQVVCRASARARAALEFIAEQRRFLLREVPGLRGAEERLALVGPLVQWDILNIAP